MYQDLGKHELAINDFAEAIEIDPKCSMAMFHMATSKLKAGQLESAIEEFSKSESIERSEEFEGKN